MKKMDAKKTTLAVLIAGAIGFSVSAIAADNAKSTGSSAIPQDPKLEQMEKGHPATGGGQQTDAQPTTQPKLESLDDSHPAAKGQAGRAGDDAAPKSGNASGASDQSDAAGAGAATGAAYSGTPEEVEKFLQSKHGSGAGASADSSAGAKDKSSAESSDSKTSGAAGPTGESGASVTSQSKDGEVHKGSADKANDAASKDGADKQSK